MLVTAVAHGSLVLNTRGRRAQQAFITLRHTEGAVLVSVPDGACVADTNQGLCLCVFSFISRSNP